MGRHVRHQRRFGLGPTGEYRHIGWLLFPCVVVRDEKTITIHAFEATGVVFVPVIVIWSYDMTGQAYQVPRRFAKALKPSASLVFPIAERFRKAFNRLEKGRFATRSRGNRPEKPGGRALFPNSTA